MALRVRFTYKVPTDSRGIEVETDWISLYRSSAPFTKNNYLQQAELIQTVQGAATTIMDTSSLVPGARYYYMIVAQKRGTSSSGGLILSFSDCIPVIATPYERGIYEIPNINLTAGEVRRVNMPTESLTAPRGCWFDNMGDLWVYGIAQGQRLTRLLHYVLANPYDIASMTEIKTTPSFNFKISGASVENILGVNFINNGYVAIVRGNIPNVGSYMIARVCTTPYDLMSGDTPTSENINCTALQAIIAENGNPNFVTNPENNKLHFIVDNGSAAPVLKEVDLSYTEGSSTAIGVSTVKATTLNKVYGNPNWSQGVPVTGVQVSTDGLTILITQSLWDSSVNYARLSQFTTPTPFDFNALGVTLNSFTPTPFGVGIVNPYLSVNSPMYREGSGFNGKPALLLVSQNPTHIIQREFTES